MRFLKRLLTAFGWSRASDETRAGAPAPQAAEEVPAYVVEDGDVARFVFKSRELFPTGLPKPQAFRLDFHPDLKRHEVSVCGLNGVSLDRVWFLGSSIRAKEGLAAIAALKVPVRKVLAAGLSCEAAPIPPDFAEHAVIVGWPVEEEAKSSRLDAQNALAAAVADLSYVLRPPQPAAT